MSLPVFQPAGVCRREKAVPAGLVVWLSLAFLAVATPEDKAKFGPKPADGYPQIVQRDDYATIQFIEAWYQSLALLAPPDKGRGFWTQLECDVSPDGLIFHSKVRGKDLRVRRHESNTYIGQQRFSNPATVLLFTTCMKVLADTGEPKLKLRFTQFRTRSLEFSVGPRILVIDSFSNGPKNEERLYILDLDTVKESLLWAAPAPAVPAGEKKDK
jgi:hypothetical protein